MKAPILAALAVFSTTTAAAAAPLADKEADRAARCLFVTMKMSGVSAGQPQAQAVVLASTYWLGRYDALRPSGEVVADMMKHKTIALAEYPDIARSCVAVIGERMQSIGAMAAEEDRKARDAGKSGPPGN